MPTSDAEKRVKQGQRGTSGKESTVQKATRTGASGRQGTAGQMAKKGTPLPDGQGR